MEREARTLKVAEEISRLLAEMGHPCALVGGLALAVHNYVRATQDVDLGVAIMDPKQVFGRMAQDLPQGLEVTARYADEEDDLGGVATIVGPDIMPIQVVNFVNAKRLRKHPGSAAVQTATLTLDDGGLKVVDLHHLIAMKLRAGALRDRADVAELLAANPDVRMDELRALCAEFGLETALDTVLAEVSTEGT